MCLQANFGHAHQRSSLYIITWILSVRISLFGNSLVWYIAHARKFSVLNFIVSVFCKTFVLELDPCFYQGMDNVMIKLLSTSRHHQQLEEFQAASSQGGADTSDNQENVLVEVSASQERRSSGSPPMKKPSKKRKK